MKSASLFLVCAALGATECLPVASDYIRARDLAFVDPAFSALPPDEAILPSPNAGVIRRLRVHDVRALATRRGIASQALTETCFEWRMRPLGDVEVRDAMSATLSGEVGDLEVLEVSTKAAPAGKVEFPKRGLREIDAQRSVYLWSGSVIYAPKRRFPLWAKVKLTMPRTCVFASEEIAAGTILENRHFREDACSRPMRDRGALLKPADAIGKRTRQRIAAGAVILPALLEDPPLIAAGERVAVDVYVGGAHLGLQAKAEKTGRLGDVIQVRNIESGRRFSARVTRAGHVVVGEDPASK